MQIQQNFRNTLCHNMCCLRHRAQLVVRPLRSATRCLSHVEDVYKVEKKLQKAGFSFDQARTILLTSSRLRQSRRRADFKDIRKVFEASWGIEDDMLSKGLSLKQARHIGCMFVALAATEHPDKGYKFQETYWNHWELSAARCAGESLEAAGARKYKGYDLAQAMLNFTILDRQP